MFNRYWRVYPWYFQLVQFIILMLVVGSFFLLAVGPVGLQVMGVTAAELGGLSEDSSRRVVNGALMYQFFTATGVFLLPALLFGYFTHPRPAKYLGLVRPGNGMHWWLAPAVVVSATPLFLFVAEGMSHIDFGAGVRAQQEMNDRMMKGLLNIGNVWQLGATLVVLAVLPGFSEELFFRGVLMRFAAKRSRGVVFPLLVSAVLFAMMHSNPYGMISIFLAGVLLGGIYYLTGSLWCSILAHGCYNGLQVLVTYLGKDGSTFKAIEESNKVPLTWVVVGTACFVGLFYLLWKNRTPLAKDWSSDYTAEEQKEESK